MAHSAKCGLHIESRRRGILNLLSSPRLYANHWRPKVITATGKLRDLRERLRDGESIICAEGYMWELERRGYLKSGAFTPEVVLEHPERVTNLHEEFVHAGSDVVEAFTYYAHRERMRLIGRHDDVEKLNMAALKLARDVADKHGCLMAGGICNTTVYDHDDTRTHDIVNAMFKEQIEWAVRSGADFVIGETYSDLGEARLALEAIQQYGNDLPAVITITPYFPDKTSDGVAIPQALRELEEMGADVVGLNCGRGPQTMLPLLREARKLCKGPLAALPVPFRTTDKERTFQSLTDPITGEEAYPLNLSPLQCSRNDIRAFAKEARDLGIQYIGLCCGNASFYLREVATVYGRQPPSTKYSPDITLSLVTGDKDSMPAGSRKFREHSTGRK